MSEAVDAVVGGAETNRKPTMTGWYRGGWPLSSRTLCGGSFFLTQTHPPACSPSDSNHVQDTAPTAETSATVAPPDAQPPRPKKERKPKPAAEGTPTVRMTGTDGHAAFAPRTPIHAQVAQGPIPVYNISGPSSGLNLKLANEIIATAMQVCEGNKYPAMSFAVVDGAGNLMALQRMDQAKILTPK